MTMYSEDFDGDIRGVLYDVRDEIYKHLLSDPRARPMLDSLSDAISHADDYRVDLMDDEDQEEEHALMMAEDAPYTKADAKRDEAKDER